MTTFLVIVIIFLSLALFAAFVVLHGLRGERDEWRDHAERLRSEAMQMINQLHDKQVEINAANEAHDELEQAVVTLREQMKGVVVFSNRLAITDQALMHAGDPEYLMRDAVRRLTTQIAEMITRRSTSSRWHDTPHSAEIFEVRVTLADLVPEVFAP